MGLFKIASVGVNIPSLGDNNISIQSMESLSSFDIIIFRPYFHCFRTYDSINFSNGGKALSSEGYNEIKKQTNHWLEELNDALRNKISNDCSAISASPRLCERSYSNYLRLCENKMEQSHA